MSLTSSAIAHISISTFKIPPPHNFPSFYSSCLNIKVKDNRLLGSFKIPPPHNIPSFYSSCLNIKVKHNRLHVSEEEVNNKIGKEQRSDELESKLVPLNREDPNYGPPALLLVGFQLEEGDKIKQLLKELDGEFLPLIFCTQQMVDASLWDAVNTCQQRLDKIEIAKSVPRICFLSGLTGEEMMMFIQSFQHSPHIEPAVFAAMVPNSAHKSLTELIQEIMADHHLTLNL